MASPPHAGLRDPGVAMAKLLQFKTQRRIDEEASVWLSRMDRGLDPSSRADLQAWVDADRRHARALIAMAALWDEMDLLRELSGLLELPPRVDAAETSSRWAARGWTWTVAAGAIPAAVVVGLLLMPGSPDATVPAKVVSRVGESATRAPVIAPSPSRRVYETAVGEQRTEALPDGSIMQLNTATRVEVAFEGAERGVTIARGEAHFEVQHDADRPFVVSAAGRRIRAVGTAFNVRLERSGRMEVTVTEGRIAVTARPADGARQASDSTPDETRVDAGEQLLADVADARWRVQPLPQEALTSRLAWQRGMLVFDGEPLETALAEVSRYTEVRFEIRDDALRAMRVGGFYKSGDIEGLVRSLEQNLGIVATRAADGRIVLSVR